MQAVDPRKDRRRVSVPPRQNDTDSKGSAQGDPPDEGSGDSSNVPTEPTRIDHIGGGGG